METTSSSSSSHASIGAYIYGSEVIVVIFFRWHDDWVNKRTLLVLSELKRVNHNLDMVDREVTNDRIRELERENGILKAKLEKMLETNTKMKAKKNDLKKLKEKLLGN
ncbi:conserved hypothetical protein [Ricinus communis]|uniref:Uncharacterized protein n=1 Tax=Ricinus communis TaxID=3988 RepID=B9RPP9_RICCO|nr:conserved hypothetical protein [Ricinus communis]